MNHEQAETQVLQAIPVLAAELSIDECIAQLQASGLSEVRATKLCVMIPEAFGLALAWRLGAKLPDEEQMFDVRNRAGETVQVPMLGQHVFSMALAMAVAVLKQGWYPPITREAFEAVSNRSAIMSVLQQIEGNLEGAGTPDLFLWGLVAEDIIADESLP
ncbi:MULTISPECIES: hypothetical protein [Alcaligenes]|uniref:Uncharacterized protein n=1 Tax=Alcaligenes phenolicus TaxID=232846 RepID=A0AAW5VZ55_9BURK|nr:MULTISPECIES: hypothetical protein [Alcaligenes]MCR4144689.1 hypothetical protein [Alcaligenes faecalis]MCX5566176.1 hypothetical protein [Alcaligenes phenolicus]